MNLPQRTRSPALAVILLVLLSGPGVAALYLLPASLQPTTIPLGGSPGPETDASPPWTRDPLYTAAQTIAGEPVPSARVLYGAFLDVFRAYGFDVPPEEIGDFYHYTYPVGDTNGDGTDDVAFDSYCVDVDGCAEPVSSLEWNCSDGMGGNAKHVLGVANGADGGLLWKRAMDPPYALSNLVQEDLPPDVAQLPVPPWPVGCVHDLVLGTVPNEDGLNDLLVYRWAAIDLGAAVYVQHNVTLLDARTGEEKWRYSDDGAWTTAGFTLARDVFLVPILQVVPQAGARIVPEGPSTLHLRGWGFAAGGFGIAHELTGVIAALDEYQPMEWAAQLDLRDGHVVWQQTTFEPQAEKSVFPVSFHAREFRLSLVPEILYSALQFTHYTGTSCCYNLVGGPAHDLVYVTFEWFPLTPKVDGYIQFLSSTLIVRDGDTGDVAYTIVVEPDHEDLRWVAVQTAGDLDGDGQSDFILFVLYFHVDPETFEISDWRWIQSVRKGTDGSELWRIDHDELVGLVPLGQTSEGGGNDVLAIWFETGGDPMMGLTNFTTLPLEVRRGADGEVRWTTSTRTNGLDTIVGNIALLGNGLPDFDQDGVGDFFVDDPEVMRDQTLVHHPSALSGRTGALLSRFSCVGAYAMPMASRDLNGDGVDDYLVLQGDQVDIWTTAYDHEGNALWSRRVLAPQQANSILSIPLVKFDNAQFNANAAKDLLLSFTLYTYDTGGSATDTGGSSSFYQSILALDGPSGAVIWSVPESDAADDSLIDGKPTPATQIYYKQSGRDDRIHKQSGPEDSFELPWIPAAVITTTLVSVAGAWVLAGRRWRE